MAASGSTEHEACSRDGCLLFWTVIKRQIADKWGFTPVCWEMLCFLGCKSSEDRDDASPSHQQHPDIWVSQYLAPLSFSCCCKIKIIKQLKCDAGEAIWGCSVVACCAGEAKRGWRIVCVQVSSPLLVRSDTSQPLIGAQETTGTTCCQNQIKEEGANSHTCSHASLSTITGHWRHDHFWCCLFIALWKCCVVTSAA